MSANIFSRGESGWSPQEGGVRHVGSLSDLGRMRLNVPRAKPLPAKQGQNKTLPLNQMANLNQTQPKRTEPNRAGPNPFAIPCPCGLTDQGPQLTQASPLSRVHQVLPRTFGTVSDKLFKSFSFFPVDDPINGFSKFIYCQLWERTTLKSKVRSQIQPYKQIYIHTYVYHSFPRLIIIGNVWQKLLCYATQARQARQELVTK